jgi:hypothetical protein
MRIDSANISMTSSYSLIQQYEKSEELRMWVGDQNPQELQNPQPATDRITLTEEAKDYLAKNQDITKVEDNQGNSEDNKFLLIKLLVEAFTGEKINLKHLEKIEDNSDVEKTDPELQKVAAEGQQPAREGWGVVYNSYESYYEHEEMSFSAEGTIKTKDGQEITFSMELTMEREFVSEKTVNIRAGDAALTDPLVINYAGTAAELSSTKFEFDLDSDGENNNISFVKPGSGFLVLDKNNDGKVNNGAELFGPQTGNGFAELAEYDEDKNNWIDENDSIFERLRIWTRGEEGSDHLNTLKKLNIGALYLPNVNSQFNLKDNENNLLGQVAATGLYLNENGTAGTIQQVDIVA